MENKVHSVNVFLNGMKPVRLSAGIGFILLCIMAGSKGTCLAQPNPRQGYQLTDPLMMNNGSRVASRKEWFSKRRPELLDFFIHHMYGVSPGKPADMTFEEYDEDTHALGGKATRKQIRVLFNGRKDGPNMDILLYVPNGVKGPVPVILGLNFNGNQTVSQDTAITITQSWMSKGRPGVVNHHSTEASRGSAADRWPVITILDRGYAIATACRNEIDPDYDDGFKNGIHAIYPELQGRDDNFATIAAWAWGLSRAMDYLQTDPDVDRTRVAVFGWSRLGKAALWAAAQDTRIAMAISNESGAGGASLFHHGKGEHIKDLCHNFPHWYCKNFRQYIGKDTELPFDQHLMLSLIAPRPLYVASAREDTWSDPKGEFLAAKAADPVYRFLGTEGLPIDTMPPVDHPVDGQIGYHVRPGKHYVKDYDWAQYLNFADRHLK